KGGAIVATSTGLLSNATKVLGDPKLPTVTDNLQPATSSISAAELKAVSANRVQRDTVHRRAARLLADKSVLACRADCFRQHNPIYQQQGFASQPCVSVIEDERLKCGAYGQYLGKTVQEHLRIWAEKNGIHTDKTEEQKKAQRERRKKYRKLKRKAWFARKLSKCTENQLSDDVNKDIESMDVDSDGPTQFKIITSQLIDNGDTFNNAKKTDDSYNADLNGTCLVNSNELLNSSAEKSCFRKKRSECNK
ncbi:unnamed protein product, partial [Schistosoma curassoni]|uniref:BCNT-C domain-containing protein n=1 Tax=Schistosoma curassoni TaxID=6186 RepID=A0A183JKQ6_9TREM